MSLFIGKDNFTLEARRQFVVRIGQEQAHP
jgi:hypothetical protein